MSEQKKSESLFWPASTFVALALLAKCMVDNALGLVIGAVCAAIAVGIAVVYVLRVRTELRSQRPSDD